MDLAPFHGWIVFIHIVGVFAFLLAHGVSAGVLLRLRSERDPAAVRTLLDLSRRSMLVMGIGALVWLVAGILAGFSGNYWTTGRYWIWASLIIAFVIFGVMTPFGRFYLDRVRAAVGIDPKTGAIDASKPVDAAALDSAINSGKPMLLATIGFGGLAVLAYLMMFKPF
ncbi:MAG: hypothetical protein ABI797_01905 [Chloroflexota bacterium]